MDSTILKRSGVFWEEGIPSSRWQGGESGDCIFFGQQRIYESKFLGTLFHIFSYTSQIIFFVFGMEKKNQFSFKKAAKCEDNSCALTQCKIMESPDKICQIQSHKNTVCMWFDKLDFPRIQGQNLGLIFH